MLGTIGAALALLLSGAGGGYMLRSLRSRGIHAQVQALAARVVALQEDQDVIEADLESVRPCVGPGELRIHAEVIKNRQDNLEKSLLRLENKTSFALGEARGGQEKAGSELKAELEQRVKDFEAQIRLEMASELQRVVTPLITREEVQAAFAEVARATAQQQQDEAARKMRQRQQEVFGTATPGGGAQRTTGINEMAYRANNGPVANPAAGLNAQLEELNRKLLQITQRSE
jgi:hypothetical protein